MTAPAATTRPPSRPAQDPAAVRWALTASALAALGVNVLQRRTRRFMETE